MKCVADLYYDTKFDAANIPDGPELITSQFHNSFNGIYLKQDREIIGLKIEANWGQVKNADYCVITPEGGSKQFYFITDIDMVNDNVAQLSLIEDTITSVGGVKNLTFIDGWCTRLSVGSDEIFENVLEENFTPAKPLEIVDITHIGPVVGSTETDSKLICTTCDILGFELKADTYTSDGGEVTVPRMPAVADSTEFTINNSEDEQMFKNVIAGVNTYNYSNQDVKDGVRFARSLGIESIITSCYTIPIYYLNQLPAGKLNSISSRIHVTDAIILSDLFDYTPKNKKVYNNFVNIVIKSIGAQNEANYKPWQICTNAGAMFFIDYADLSPNGKPYCRPGLYLGKSYVDSKDHFFDTGISGYTWENVPITFTALTDYEKMNANIKLNAAELQNTIAGSELGIATWNNRFGAFNDLLGMTRGAAGGVIGSMAIGKLGAGYGTASQYGASFGQASSGMTNFVNSLASYTTREERSANIYRQGQMADILLSKERMQYEYKSNIIVPTTMFPESSAVSAYVGNGFYVYMTRPTTQDLQREDEYYTRFGYSVSEELTKEKLFTRQNFNFVQANSVYVDDSNEEVTIRRRKAIQDVFSSGVRIWHVRPSHENLLNNPIKEVQ